MNHVEAAKALFCQGYNCAQSVAGAFHQEMGLPLDVVLKLSSSFGAGMGGMRETCGAVTGMFLVAGALWGYDSLTEDSVKKAHYARIRQLAAQFQERQETLICRELLKSLPGKLQQEPMPRTPAYYKVRPCVRFVETAAALLEQMIAEEKSV